MSKVIRIHRLALVDSTLSFDPNSRNEIGYALAKYESGNCQWVVLQCNGSQLYDVLWHGRSFYWGDLKLQKEGYLDVQAALEWVMNQRPLHYIVNLVEEACT